MEVGLCSGLGMAEEPLDGGQVDGMMFQARVLLVLMILLNLGRYFRQDFLSQRFFHKKETRKESSGLANLLAVS